MRTKCQRNMPVQFKIVLAVKLLNIEKFLCIGNPFFREPYHLVLYFVVLVLLECRDKKIRHLIQIGLDTRRSGDDQRHLRRIKEYHVRFIYDHIIKFTQETLLLPADQIIKQIIKSKRTMRCVNNICCINFPFLVTRELVLFIFRDSGAHRKPQKLIDRTHFLSIPVCQITVGCDKHTRFSRKRIQIQRHRSRQCLSLTGIHLHQISLMQTDSSQNLHIIGTLAKNPLIRFNTYGKCLHQKPVKLLPMGDPHFKLNRLARQFFVRKCPVSILQSPYFL